eukprot:scaffold97370_cov35-Tisochrysis_lutea.AAC.2
MCSSLGLKIGRTFVLEDRALLIFALVVRISEKLLNNLIARAALGLPIRSPPAPSVHLPTLPCGICPRALHIGAIDNRQ